MGVIKHSIVKDASSNFQSKNTAPKHLKMYF